MKSNLKSNRYHTPKYSYQKKNIILFNHSNLIVRLYLLMCIEIFWLK